MSIPRIVYQAWLSGDLPEPLARNLRHNQAMAPAWTFRVFRGDEAEDFIQTEYGREMLALYRKIEPCYGAARADLFRYLLIYRCGGFYMDMKARLTRDLSEVLQADDEYLLGRWADCGEPQYQDFGRHAEIPGGLGEYQQWHVVARAGHPFLEAVVKAVAASIKTYLPATHGVGRGGVLRTTGPIVYTQAILPVQHAHPHRMIRSFADLGLQYSCLESTDAHHRLFKQHYSTLTAPVVEMDVKKRAMDLSLRSARRLRRIWSR